MPLSSVPLVVNATVSALVAEKGEITTVVNAGPSSVIIGHYSTLQQGDQDVYPLAPNQFIVNNGQHEVYATLPAGQATMYKLTGIVFTGML